jgi:predicted GNAT family acetyltransferase
MSAVRHNTGEHRFELDTAAGLAVADYRLSDGVMTIFHTEVPLPLRGRGIGCSLVKGALEEVRKLGLKVVPQCWFVREYMDRNSEFADLLQ